MGAKADHVLSAAEQQAVGIKRADHLSEIARDAARTTAVGAGAELTIASKPASRAAENLA